MLIKYIKSEKHVSFVLTGKDCAQSEEEQHVLGRATVYSAQGVMDTSCVRREKKEPHTVEAQLMDCRHGAGEAGSSPLKRRDWERKGRGRAAKNPNKVSTKARGRGGEPVTEK